MECASDLGIGLIAATDAGDPGHDWSGCMWALADKSVASCRFHGFEMLVWLVRRATKEYRPSRSFSSCRHKSPTLWAVFNLKNRANRLFNFHLTPVRIHI